MAEYDSLAQDVLAQAETDQQRQQERDRALLDQVLEIYGQKYVAEQLKKAGKAEWSRESLNRWVNGKGSAKTFTAAEEALLRNPACASSRLSFSLYRSLRRNWRHSQRV